MEDTKYFSRSWAMLTRDKGWIKPLLVMTAATLVPIAGMLGNKGYVLEWARLTAWGVDSAPKQRNVQVGACIHSGWRAFLVDLVWGCCLGLGMGLINGLVAALPDALAFMLAFLLSIVWFAVSICSGVVIAIAEIRTSIYERVSAGLRVDRVFEMIRRDPRGFGRVILVSLACSAVVGVVSSMVFGVMFAAGIPLIALVAGSGDPQVALTMLATGIVPIIAVGSIIVLGFALVGIIIDMIVHTAAALWMRQFDVPAWGASADPLPHDSAPSDRHRPEVPGLPAAATERPETPGPHTSQAAPVVSTKPVEAQATAPIEVQPTAPIEIQPTETIDLQSTTAEQPVSELEQTEQSTAGAPDDEFPINGDLQDVDELYGDLYRVVHQNDEAQDGTQE